MSAMPIGMPGWPEFAACTASMARKRMALARSRRLGVGMAGGRRGCGKGRALSHTPRPDLLPREKALRGSGRFAGAEVGFAGGHERREREVAGDVEGRA